MNDDSQPVTSILSHVIKPEKLDDFIEWRKKINQKVSEYKGFSGVTSINPKNPSIPEYIVILRFDSIENLRQWESSQDLKDLLAESESFTESVKKMQEHAGLEIFFDWSTDPKHLPRPKIYKQILIAMAVVFPLVVLITEALGPYVFDLPFPLTSLVFVVIISPVMTLIFPYVTRLTHSWLYKESK